MTTFLAAATGGNGLPDWLTIAGAVVGLAGGVVAVVTVVIATKALRETRMSPVRQRQHELVDELVGQVAELQSNLQAVNSAVQQPDGGDATREAATAVEAIARRMTTPEVTDPELRRRLQRLRDTSITHGRDGSFVKQLDYYARLMDRLRGARKPFADQEGYAKLSLKK